MELSEHTISALGEIITGNGGLSPYRSGPQLVDFFNKFGFDDEYGEGFPSRWLYAEMKLKQLNGSRTMEQIILAAVDPRIYLRSGAESRNAVDYLNQFLEFDGYEISPQGKAWRIHKLASDTVAVQPPYEGSTELTHVFINEQIQKCDQKLGDGDFDGAITNARSLLEAVLVAIEHEMNQDAPEYDGDLPKLYKRVQQLLNLSPGQEGLGNSLRQILSGMISVVQGLSSMRNTTSDSHVASYRAEEHHARLAVNAARTMARFLFETKEYQREG